MDEKLEQRINELVREEIAIVPYDDDWPRRYEAEARYLRKRCSRTVLERIEHFGSTAVPGLAAKPIIDILACVREPEDVARTVVPHLSPDRYEYIWRTDVSPPYAWFIKRNNRGARTHHIHMVGADSSLWERLLFRDYLRAHADEARRYEDLKRALAQRYAKDRIGYTEGKTAYIAAVTARARSDYRA